MVYISLEDKFTCTFKHLKIYAAKSHEHNSRVRKRVNLSIFIDLDQHSFKILLCHIGGSTFS